MMPSRPSCSHSLGSRGIGLRRASSTTQQPSAPMPTRSEVTQRGPISRIRTALKMNEQPQMAPSRMIQTQSRRLMEVTSQKEADATPAANGGRTVFDDGQDQFA